MGVRVAVRLVAPDGHFLESVALLNGGFETREPSLLLPAAAAQRLLAHRAHGKVVTARQAVSPARLVRADEAVDVRVITPDREGGPARCVLFVSPEADEVLLSDSAIDAVGVTVVNFSHGLWRFTDEARERDSAAQTLW